MLVALVLGMQALLTPNAVASSPVSISGADLSLSASSHDSAGPDHTATTFMAIPSGPVLQGTLVILIAQVAPVHAAGTVQFKDGERELGPPQPVIGGFALSVTSRLTDGSHLLTAVFTAANRANFSPSMSEPVSLTVVGWS